ncbi:unnamed protein product [Sphagnum balticum]
MQTFMELIKTCINKEPNANPSDVSPNASLNVLTVEAITKALVSTTRMDEIFYFGKFKIDPSEVFLVTDHSYAFVNLKPVVPGKFITTLSSRRVVNRFLDLTSEEVSDLWLTAKYVGQKLEPFYNASSLTFTIQDGPKAGQTVPHVHVHILPRKDGDFENNDEIYDVIDEKEKELAKKLNLDLERKDRTFEEMANEAANLRALF